MAVASDPGTRSNSFLPYLTFPGPLYPALLNPAVSRRFWNLPPTTVPARNYNSNFILPLVSSSLAYKTFRFPW